MNETAADIDALQAILDSSASRSGAHLRTAFDQGKRLSAPDFIRRLDGIIEIHLAVNARDGAPLVAPVDAILFKARLWIGLPDDSLRSKLLRYDQRVSASFIRDDLAFIAHGTFVEVLATDAAEYRTVVRSLYVDAYGDWMGDYIDSKTEAGGQGLTGFIEPRVMFTKSS